LGAGIFVDCGDFNGKFEAVELQNSNPNKDCIKKLFILYSIILHCL